MIGYAGSDDKVCWLEDELGFDRAFNYKTVDVKKSLKEAAPDGVDCYFDNVNPLLRSRLRVDGKSFGLVQVGGHFSVTVRSHMRHFGRISVCGAISMYNEITPTMAPCIEPVMVFKQLTMEGFLIHRWLDRYDEGMRQMAQWIREVRSKFHLLFTLNRLHVNQGKIKVRETTTQGFENMPEAFIAMLQGRNFGKAVVKV